jgi:hypothetical protein
MLFSEVSWLIQKASCGTLAMRVENVPGPRVPLNNAEKRASGPQAALLPLTAALLELPAAAAGAWVVAAGGLLGLDRLDLVSFLDAFFLFLALGVGEVLLGQLVEPLLAAFLLESLRKWITVFWHSLFSCIPF